MARPAALARSRAHVPHLTLNSDGHRHPLENTLALAVVVLGVVSLASAFSTGLHLIGAVTGLLGVLLGGYDQYISATTAERMVIIPGLGASALGLALALAHGGFVM